MKYNETNYNLRGIHEARVFAERTGLEVYAINRYLILEEFRYYISEDAVAQWSKGAVAINILQI